MKRQKNGNKVSSMSFHNNDKSSSLVKINEKLQPSFNSEKHIRDQSAVRFHKINFEGHEASMNLDASNDD